MKLPGLNLDPAELNPIRCCVCTALGHRDIKAETIIRGYSVCLDHLTIDEHLTVRDYAEAIRGAFSG